jgi:hypothetical protein
MITSMMNGSGTTNRDAASSEKASRMPHHHRNAFTMRAP